MATNIAAIVLSSVSLVLALVGLIRTRKLAEINTQMQSWNWRQRFLQSLSSLSYQVNQAHIVLHRENQRLNAIRETVLQVEAKFPEPPPRLAGLKAQLDEMRDFYELKSSDLSAYEQEILPLWNHPNPTSDLDAVVQKHTRSNQNVLESVQATTAQLEVHHEAIRALLR